MHKELLTVKTKFYKRENGPCVELFFKNNPWKLLKPNLSEKVRRYCVICGKERNPSGKWDDSVARFWGGRLTICYTMECREKEWRLNFVPLRLVELLDKEVLDRQGVVESKDRIEKMRLVYFKQESYDTVQEKEMFSFREIDERT